MATRLPRHWIYTDETCWKCRDGCRGVKDGAEAMTKCVAYRVCTYIAIYTTSPMYRPICGIPHSGEVYGLEHYYLSLSLSLFQSISISRSTDISMYIALYLMVGKCMALKTCPKPPSPSRLLPFGVPTRAKFDPRLFSSRKPCSSCHAQKRQADRHEGLGHVRVRGGG